MNHVQHSYPDALALIFAEAGGDTDAAHAVILAMDLRELRLTLAAAIGLAGLLANARQTRLVRQGRCSPTWARCTVTYHHPDVNLRHPITGQAAPPRRVTRTPRGNSQGSRGLTFGRARPAVEPKVNADASAKEPSPATAPASAEEPKSSAVRRARFGRRTQANHVAGQR